MPPVSAYANKDSEVLSQNYKVGQGPKHCQYFFVCKTFCTSQQYLFSGQGWMVQNHANTFPLGTFVTFFFFAFQKIMPMLLQFFFNVILQEGASCPSLGVASADDQVGTTGGGRLRCWQENLPREHRPAQVRDVPPPREHHVHAQA